MANKEKIIIVLGIFIIIVVSFLIGLLVGKSGQAKPDILFNTYGQTFYATIEKIVQNNNNTIVFVKGLDVNDINYRGEFTLSIKDNTAMTWRGEELSISDLDMGDNISITFTDEMLLTISPTPIKDVQRIQLLDDEK